MITLDQLAKYGSNPKSNAYIEIEADLLLGNITHKELKQVYTRFRKRIMSQVARTRNSDIGFLPGNEPYMKKVSELENNRDMVHQIADALRYYNSKSYTRKQRLEQRATAIAKLAEHGIHISPDQWDDWRRFIQWFKHTEFASKYDSDSQVTQEVFQKGSNAEEWEKAFREYIAEEEKGNA